MLQIDRAKAKLLIISRSAPRPYHGSTLHMEDLVRYLAGDYEVHYLTLKTAKEADLTGSSVHTAYFGEPAEVPEVPFDHSVTEEECKLVERACRKTQPSLVIVDYSWLGDFFDAPYFRERPSVRKIIFIHDLRVRIMPSYVKMGLVAPEANPWTEQREAELIAKADAALTLNDDDRRVAQAMAPRVKMLKMGMAVFSRYVDPGAAVPGRCIYVASELNENVFAAMWLLKFAWPRVIESCPSASLVICGTVCGPLREFIGSQRAWLGETGRLNLELAGKVPDLTGCYASAQIALVPHWMEGGIKIKHIEALAHGLPVVCTQAGIDGLPQAAGRSSFIGEMPDEFAAHVIGLIKDPSALARAREQARNLSLQLTPDAVYREVGDYLRGL